MRRLQPRLTRIELLIVVGLLAFFSECEMPVLFGSQTAAFALADCANLRWLGQQLELYRMQHKGELPDEGGHEFVLATWSIVAKTEESFDRYFTPGRRDDDPDYRRLRMKLERGEKIWQDLKSTTSLDTHYAGRAKEHLRSATRGEGEAWMADDNEGRWSHADGTVNVLFHGGFVRTYSLLDLLNRGYLHGEIDPNHPLVTWGPSSPIPECRKLDK